MADRALKWDFTAEAFRKVTRTLDQIYASLAEEAEFRALPEVEKIAAIHSILMLGSDDKEPDDLDEAYEDGTKKPKSQVTLATGHAFKGKQKPYVFVCNLQGLAPHKEDPEEEKRCWMYVVCTRAQEVLQLTAATQAPDFKGFLRNTHPNPLLQQYLDSVRLFAQQKKAIT